jgi:hypothetical protein
MTAVEVVNMVSILTDDSQAWFPYENGRDWTFLFDTIKQAQLKVIEKYYMAQDERALRTLYTSCYVINGTPIPSNPFTQNQSLLYPRALLLEDVYTNGSQDSITHSVGTVTDFQTGDAYHHFNGLDFILQEDGSCAINTCTLDSEIIPEYHAYDHTLNIIKADGTICPLNKADTSLYPLNLTWKYYGGTNDLWNTTWVPNDINGINFGINYNVKTGGAAPNPGEIHYSWMLYCHNFNFNIPSNAVITGIKVGIKKGIMPYLSGRVNYNNPVIDNVKITIYYSILPTIRYSNYYTATYENYDTYINLARTKSTVYTLKDTGIVGRTVKQIFFNSTDSGTFYYLQEPRQFFWDDTGLNNVTLALPPEYHLEVCCLAAEMLNNLDKMETERSVTMGRDEKIPLESL